MYSLLRYYLYASYHFYFQSHMNFPFRIQTHAYVSQVSLLSIQYSFYQLGTNHLHHNQIPEILVCPGFWHLLFVSVEFHPLLVNDVVVFLLPINYFSRWGSVPVVLSRTTLSVLSSEVPQDLTFFYSISRAMDETGLWFSRRAIHIPFSVLVSALSLLEKIPWRGVFFSLFPAVTSTVGIFSIRFLIKRFYYTFVNRLGNFHTLKHINSFLKRGRLTIKALYIGLFSPYVRHTVKEDFV